MLNCPNCGHPYPRYGQSDTWRDAAARWRDYAIRLEQMLEVLEGNDDPPDESWEALARERLYLMRVAYAKLSGDPAPAKSARPRLLSKSGAAVLARIEAC